MDEDEAKNLMIDIDHALAKFWVDGWMSSYLREEIIDKFPPRLKHMIR